MFNCCGYGIVYFQFEEINIVLCFQKMVLISEILLLDNIQFYVSIILVWDNIDCLEEMLLGEGILYRVNGIVVQVRYFGLYFFLELLMYIVKIKKRSVEVLGIENFFFYNVGDCCGFCFRRFVEVIC